jgi:glutamate formiminotransferase/formiminotetrahydrofolate cyclodeaminase
MPLVECVPNFSEGRRPEVITALRDAIAAIPTVAILDVSSDPAHNRTVVTFVVERDQAVDAAFAGIRTARDRIDLTQHQGEHPRMGAADVVPFVPLEGTSMEECVALARKLGERVGRELEIPVFLYERAASRPERVNLADVRRGEFEGLRDEIGHNPLRDPDFGPRYIHPSFGTVAIGARPLLVAFNVYLGPATALPIAKEVAKAVRSSSGGLPFVKALGLEVDNQAQVSMNLVDTDQTPIHRAFDQVKLEAEQRGAQVSWSEIVGLVPQRALDAVSTHHLQLAQFKPSQVLENRIREAASPSPSPSSAAAGTAAFLASVAAPTPVPGGGSVVALAGALAAALARMVAGLTIGKKKYVDIEAQMRRVADEAAELQDVLARLVQRDADSYAAVTAALRLPKEPAAAAAARAASLREALLGAARVPLETARAATAVARLAAAVAETGNRNAVSDAGVGALLAEAACRGAVYNVRINLSGLEAGDGKALADEAGALVAEAARYSKAALAAVEAAIGA